MVDRVEGFGSVYEKEKFLFLLKEGVVKAIRDGADVVLTPSTIDKTLLADFG